MIPSQLHLQRIRYFHVKGDVVQGSVANVQSTDRYEPITLADLAGFDSLTARCL